jgi:hypothetical protein
MAESIVTAYRYTGTLVTRKREYAVLERLGDFASFEIPPEWLPDGIEPNELVQVECDKPMGIFAISVVESPEGADNFDGPEGLDVE